MSAHNNHMPGPLAIIQGVGPGTGTSIARIFGKAYSVVLLSRHSSSFDGLVEEIKSQGGHAIGIETDVSNKESIATAFSAISKLGEGGKPPRIAAAVLNGFGGHGTTPFLDLSYEKFTSGMETPGRGSFLFAQSVLPGLLGYAGTADEKANPATLIFTGSTAALKGSAGFASFSTGRFAVRSLSQSLAREFGPRGIHVAHLIIDGLINTEQTRNVPPTGPNAKVEPDRIADTYWYLHTQPKSAWTQELDLRPFAEKW